VTAINVRPTGYNGDYLIDLRLYVNILLMCLHRAKDLIFTNKNYKYNFYAYSRQQTI